MAVTFFVLIGKSLIFYLLTRDNREKETLTAPEELPMEMSLQAKPPYDVVKE